MMDVIHASQQGQITQDLFPKIEINHFQIYIGTTKVNANEWSIPKYNALSM